MNVKKSTSLFLAFLLLVSNIGMAFNVHYCGESIAAISLHSELLSLTEPDGCCEKTAVVEKDSCCKDKVDNATVKIVLFDISTPFLVPVQRVPVFAKTLHFQKAVVNDFYVAINAPPLYQLYHQYIFYA
jgi:hypothetical protein